MARQVGVAGHSLGGKISVFVASRRPDPSGLGAALAVVGETTNASGGGMRCAPAAENSTRLAAGAVAILRK